MPKGFKEFPGAGSPLFLAILFAVSLAVFVAVPAEASCCSFPNCVTSGSCCNIFCCNCDGPCSNYGCGCPPVHQVGDVCGTCPGYDTCVNSGGQCVGYCNPGYTCCNNGQSCCPTSAANADVKTPTTKPQPCTVPASSESVPRQPAIQRFKAIDKNNDKKISWQETKTWLAANGSSSTPKKLKDLRTGFDKLDKNSNGTIEPAEFDAELK